MTAATTNLDAVESDLGHLARRWGRGEINRVEWEAAREGLASRSQALRDRLGVLSLPAFDPGDVMERWDEMGLVGRRAILSAVFERIEVYPATSRRYDPDRIKLVWRIPCVGQMTVPSTPHAT